VTRDRTRAPRDGTLGPVNRTERLYALVEEMRAVAPRPRTAHHLADRFEVSVRTVQRDLGALMQAGVPLYATPGPGGGYAIDPAHTLPPVNFTSDEAAALAIALARPGSSPLAEALRSALRKVVAAMPPAEADAARRLAGRIHFMADDHDVRPPSALTMETALVTGRVVEIDYRDRHGDLTHRAVEPMAVVAGSSEWYLMAHCRLREDVRCFRLDRVEGARLTDEPVPLRDIEFGDDIPLPVRPLQRLE
jgi:predicted DNA-binding transcriptional regulator YafY